VIKKLLSIGCAHSAECIVKQTQGVEMIRKIKTLGVALVAVLALSAVVASAASAVNYTAASYPATGTGTSELGNDTFNTEGGTVECQSHFEGTLGAASTQFTVAAKYTNCRAFGFLEAHVTMGSCDYLFTEATETEKDKFHAKELHVICTNSAEPITISAGTCKVSIGAHTPTGTVHFTNDTAAGDIQVQAAVTGIQYTVTQDGFLCPFNGTGAKTGGTYTQDKAVTFDAPVNIHVG
jgi:hypothetical protein